MNFWPLHCECLQQCLAAGAFAPHFNPYCFRTPRADAAWSNVPVPSDDGATTFHEWPSLKRVSAEEALAVEFAPHLQPPSPPFVPFPCSFGEHREYGSSLGVATCLFRIKGGAWPLALPRGAVQAFGLPRTALAPPTP